MAVKWTEKGQVVVRVLEPGTTLTIPFCPGEIAIQQKPYAEVNCEEVLRASAQEPCPHFLSDSYDIGNLCSEECFSCAVDAKADLRFCLGDRYRFPLSIG